MKITAIAGRNGSGKTLYIDQLRKQLASDKVRYIAFTDSYGVNVDGQYYLQLRWNQHDIDHETPTVGDLLQRAYLLAGEDTEERRAQRDQLYQLFHMDEFLDKYIITLSSGELRKFQLTKTLFANPKLLIMDNPFIDHARHVEDGRHTIVCRRGKMDRHTGDCSTTRTVAFSAESDPVTSIYRQRLRLSARH